MGTEILIPVLIGAKWGLAIFACLGLTYAANFRFRNSSPVCRMALRTILYLFGGMLFTISAVSALMILAWIFVILTAKIEPPTDRFMILGCVVILAGMVACAWWGLGALTGHFKRSLHA